MNPCLISRRRTCRSSTNSRNEEERQLFKLGLIKPNNYARPYALPPGVPQDRVKAIEAAFQKTLRDPELITEADRSKLNISAI
jgi:hypothetical protein